jgi:hypothetical protein
VGITAIRTPLFLGDTIELLQQSLYFRLAILGHRDASLAIQVDTLALDTVAPGDC